MYSTAAPSALHRSWMGLETARCRLQAAQRSAAQRTHLDERLQLDALGEGGQHEAVGGEGDVVAVVGLGALQTE
jgi:hypothetical protein